MLLTGAPFFSFLLVVTVKNQSEINETPMKDKISLLLLFFLPFTGCLKAQVPTVPISISKDSEMSFGTIAVSSGGGTVVLHPSGSRTASGGIMLPSLTGTVSAARFTVTGDAGYTYAITLPATDFVLTNTVSSATMTINVFTSTPSATGTLSGGTETVLVGATLNVSGSQTAGSYTNAAGFEVTVQYN